jgi:hypothetical protein
MRLLLRSEWVQLPTVINIRSSKCHIYTAAADYCIIDAAAAVAAA